jgi:hypothetical protein
MVGVFLNGEAPADNIATVEGKIVSASNIRVGSQYHIEYQLDGHDGTLEGYWQDYEKDGQRVIRITIADMDDVMYNSYLFCGSKLTYLQAWGIGITDCPACRHSFDCSSDIHPSFTVSKQQSSTDFEPL